MRIKRPRCGQSSLNGSNPQRPGEDSGDDVHRLAQLICQLDGGRNNQSPDKIQDASLRKFVERCLSDDSPKRRGNARDALNQLYNDRKGSWLSRYWPRVAAAVLAPALIAFAALWWWDNDAKTIDINRKDDQITSLGRDNERLKNALKPPQKPPPANGVPAFSEEEATRLFHDYYGKDNKPSMDIDKWIEAELRSKPDKVARAKEKIRDYQHALLNTSNEEYELKVNPAFRKPGDTWEPVQKDADWLITVYVDGEQAGQGVLKAGLKFAWQPGKVIRLLVEDERAWYYPVRNNLIDKSYSGDYALWRLHQDLQDLTQESTRMTGEIANFPKDGPKREYVKPLPTLPLSKGGAG